MLSPPHLQSHLAAKPVLIGDNGRYRKDAVVSHEVVAAAAAKSATSSNGGNDGGDGGHGGPAPKTVRNNGHEAPTSKSGNDFGVNCSALITDDDKTKAGSYMSREYQHFTLEAQRLKGESQRNEAEQNVVVGSMATTATDPGPPSSSMSEEVERSVKEKYSKDLGADGGGGGGYLPPPPTPFPLPAHHHHQAMRPWFLQGHGQGFGNGDLGQHAANLPRGADWRQQKHVAEAVHAAQAVAVQAAAAAAAVQEGGSHLHQPHHSSSGQQQQQRFSSLHHPPSQIPHTQHRQNNLHHLSAARERDFHVDAGSPIGSGYAASSVAAVVAAAALARNYRHLQQQRHNDVYQKVYSAAPRGSSTTTPSRGYPFVTPHGHRHKFHQETPVGGKESTERAVFASPHPVSTGSSSVPSSPVEVNALSRSPASPYSHLDRSSTLCPVPEKDPKCWRDNHDTSRPTKTAEPGTKSPAAHGKTSEPCYPAHFTARSLIQLSNGDLKRVEDLEANDFVESAVNNCQVQVDQSVVISFAPPRNGGEEKTVILRFLVGKQKLHVAVEVAVEHPFYVYGKGWSSVSPGRTLERYNLSCQALRPDDVCISLTNRSPASSTKSSAGVAFPVVGEEDSDQPLNLKSNGRRPSSVASNEGSNEVTVSLSSSTPPLSVSSTTATSMKPPPPPGERDKQRCGKSGIDHSSVSITASTGSGKHLTSSQARPSRPSPSEAMIQTADPDAVSSSSSVTIFPCGAVGERRKRKLSHPVQHPVQKLPTEEEDATSGGGETVSKMRISAVNFQRRWDDKIKQLKDLKVVLNEIGQDFSASPVVNDEEKRSNGEEVKKECTTGGGSGSQFVSTNDDIAVGNAAAPPSPSPSANVSSAATTGDPSPLSPPPPPPPYSSSK